MPDPFTNARPFFDVSFPSSGDSFSISGFKNQFQALGFMDNIFAQPRAHNPADLRIMVRGRDASSFYNPIYAFDADKRVFFNSGDSAVMTAPSSSPRLDIVYLTPSGDIRIVTGTEAATPTLPALSPSGDTRMPICAIYHKSTETKIVNFEDKDSNTGDGYIYQDLRPWLRYPIQTPDVNKHRVVTLTDAATIGTPANQGSLFRVQLGGNRTLGNPTDPVDGQKAIWEIRQDATGSRTLTFGSAFNLSADVGPITLSTGGGSGDKIAAIYDGPRGKWDIVAFLRGY